MYCTKCNNHIATCTCPDIDERLADVAKSRYIFIATCPVCGRHVDRCICVPAKVTKQ